MKIHKISEWEINKNEDASEDVICPFCHEGDFDLIGLKLHLLAGHCEKFNEIVVPQRYRT